MKKYLLVLALLVCRDAFAERADLLKPMTVSSETAEANLQTRKAKLQGAVILTRGTLLIKGARADVAEDPEGYAHLVIWAAPGEVVSFRQKKDGGPDLWTEGEAEKIEYDDKLGTVKLFSKARIAALENGKTTSEAKGAFLAYNSRTEDLALRNQTSGESRAAGGRVEIVYDKPLRSGDKAASVK